MSDHEIRQLIGVLYRQELPLVAYEAVNELLTEEQSNRLMSLAEENDGNYSISGEHGNVEEVIAYVLG